MNSPTIIHDNICNFLYKKCHLQSYHSDIKYHMTLNITFSVGLASWSLIVASIDMCSKQFLLCYSLLQFFFLLKKQISNSYIRIFISKTMLCGIDNIQHNIPTFMLYMGNVMHNIVSPTQHCYGC